jgi:hypothetical protein
MVTIMALSSQNSSQFPINRNDFSQIATADDASSEADREDEGEGKLC